MKVKVSTILLCVTIIFAMTACGISDIQILNRTDGDDNGENSENTATVSIDEQVVLDQDGYKIIAQSVANNVNLESNTLTFQMENNTENDIMFETVNIVVNGIMMETGMSCPVTANSVESAELVLENLEWSEITQVSTIELQFQIFDGETFEKIYKMDTPYKIETTASDFTQVNDDTGVPIYDANNIKIIAKGSEENPFYGDCYKLYIQNNTKVPIYIETSNMFVNGETVDTHLSAKVLSKTKKYIPISYHNWELAGIPTDSIKDIQLQLHILNMDTNTPIADGERCIIMLEE